MDNKKNVKTANGKIEFPMAGWFKELEIGSQLHYQDKKLNIKFIVTDEGIKIATLSSDPNIAEKLFVKTGFNISFKPLVCG